MSKESSAGAGDAGFWIGAAGGLLVTIGICEKLHRCGADGWRCADFTEKIEVINLSHGE